MVETKYGGNIAVEVVYRVGNSSTTTIKHQNSIIVYRCGCCDASWKQAHVRCVRGWSLLGLGYQAEVAGSSR